MGSYNFLFYLIDSHNILSWGGGMRGKQRMGSMWSLKQTKYFHLKQTFVKLNFFIN